MLSEIMLEMLFSGILQRFQPSETEKREVVQVLVILVLMGGLELFCLKICDVLAQQDKFFYRHCDHVWLFVKFATNVPVLNFYNSFRFL